MDIYALNKAHAHVGVSDILAPSHEVESYNIRDILERYFRPRHNLVTILEAGCGRRWDLSNLAFPHQLTGVDLDPEALRIRREINRDLDVAIQGDLRTIELPNEGFDVIYSSYVLEHISDPRTVLEQFLKWTRPGGVIVIRIPDGNSAYGLLTRLSPHWVHILYYRFIQGNRNAGKPGYPPYPTIYNALVSRSGMEDFSAESGLVPILRMRTRVALKPGLRGLIVGLSLRLVHVITFGRFSYKHCTLTYIFTKPFPGS